MLRHAGILLFPVKNREPGSAVAERADRLRRPCLAGIVTAPCHRAMPDKSTHEAARLLVGLCGVRITSLEHFNSRGNLISLHVRWIRIGT